MWTIITEECKILKSFEIRRYKRMLKTIRMNSKILKTMSKRRIFRENLITRRNKWIDCTIQNERLLELMLEVRVDEKNNRRLRREYIQ